MNYFLHIFILDKQLLVSSSSNKCIRFREIINEWAEYLVSFYHDVMIHHHNQLLSIVKLKRK